MCDVSAAVIVLIVVSANNRIAKNLDGTVGAVWLNDWRKRVPDSTPTNNK